MTFFPPRFDPRFSERIDPSEIGPPGELRTSWTYYGNNVRFARADSAL